MKRCKGLPRLSLIDRASALFLITFMTGCVSTAGGSTEQELIWDEHWESYMEGHSEEPEMEVGVTDDREMDIHQPNLYYDLEKKDGEECDVFASCDMNESSGELWGKQEVCRNEDTRDRG